MTRRLLLALLFALSASAVGYAVQYTASETITVAGAAIGFTGTTINAGGGHSQASFALCRNEGAEIRFTVDQTKTVTATANGALIEDGEWVPGLIGSDVLNNFRAISTGLPSSKLNCFYFGS